MERYRIDASKEYNARLKRLLPGGAHYNFRSFGEEPPLHFVSGRGSRLFDMDGNEYLDMHCKYGPLILGHNHPEYNEALKRQIDMIQSVQRTDMDLEACELINACMPGVEMVRFGLSGTEIVQNALRLARGYTGKNRFVRFIGHYHGSADNIIGGRYEGPERPVPVDFPSDPRGTDGRAEGILESQSFLLPWNDPVVLERTLRSRHGEIAAVICEPILINGGGIMPRPGYLEGMRALCDELNIVLIFDEIITGFRAALGGAQEIVGVVPDLTTLGKAIASGMPVSALGGKRAIMTLYEKKRVMHAGTFNGYPLGMAAVRATLTILRRGGGEAYRHMARCRAAIAAALLEEARRIGFPLAVQGTDTIGIFHCRERAVQDVEDLGYMDQIRDTVLYNELSYHGILVAPVSRLYMNVMFDDADLDFFRERIPAVLRSAQASIAENGL